ncbi:unnamed protein product [Acanthoscelides obtectus]|uniref:Uncharacterized protein n=1 Tax=Acanthoscelides obtectus TaxID=200917 RepID=A0A9P0L6T7_ACAOB|nr:unnamed protein product [Acanthoscelides obtectus]CAK1649267.1 Tachykinin-like peptides receptor 86C [Acanthoscelides obtectus]
MSRKLSLVIISLIWTASMILALPCLFYSTTITGKYNGVTWTGCILVWPDNKLVGSPYDLW